MLKEIKKQNELVDESICFEDENGNSLYLKELYDKEVLGYDT